MEEMNKNMEIQHNAMSTLLKRIGELEKKQKTSEESLEMKELRKAMEELNSEMKVRREEWEGKKNVRMKLIGRLE